MMTDERDWKKAAKNAEHYKALGLHRRVYLSRGADLDGYPWHLITSMEQGGMYRNGVPVSLSFEGHDKDSGLTFAWHVDLEPREANGSAKLQLDMHLVHDIETRIPKTLKPKYKEIFKQHIERLNGEVKQAQEWLDTCRFNIDVLTGLTERK